MWMGCPREWVCLSLVSLIQGRMRCEIVRGDVEGMGDRGGPRGGGMFGIR